MFDSTLFYLIFDLKFDIARETFDSFVIRFELVTETAGIFDLKLTHIKEELRV